MRLPVFVFLFSALISIHAWSDSLSLRADEWLPFNGDPKSASPGYMVELANKIFQPKGYTVDYQLMPWTRALATVKKGEADCVIGAYATDAEGFLFPQESWGMDSINVFVNTGDKWKYHTPMDLLTRKVAIIQDYSYSTDLDAFIDKNPAAFDKAVGVDALDKNIHKLVAGRVDTLIESKTVLLSSLVDLKLENKLTSAGNITEPLPLYIACSPANPERSKQLLAIVDEQTKALRKSGEFEKILQKYHLTDWKK